MKQMATSTNSSLQDSAKGSSPQSKYGREAWSMLVELVHAERANWILVCQEFGITPPQGYLLAQLQGGELVPMKGLANALACDASNITGLVDKLEARGLIERRCDPMDRRVKMIAVTKAGAKFRKHLLDRMSEPAIALDLLSVAEKKTLRDILKRVCVSLASSSKQSS
jgi:DNA-binding MarR family transcriptional regulator